MSFLGAKDIEAFKRKRVYTGEQVGKATILALVHILIHGNNDRLFTVQQLDRMQNTIQTQEEWIKYSELLDVSRWLSTAKGLYEAHHTAFDATARQLMTIFREAENAQQVYSYIDKLPLILTMQDYEDLREQAKAKVLAQELSVFDVLLDALDYYIEMLDKDSKADTPLTHLQQAYEQEAIKSPTILGNYNRVYGIGYYTLAGKKLTEEQYNAIIAKPTLEELLNSLLPKEKQSQDEVLQYTLNRINNYFDNGEEAEEPAFHVSKAKPKGLTKWDLLASGSLRDFFTLELLGDNTKHTQAKLYEEAYNEFKQAFDRLVLDADEKYGLGLGKYPAREWGKLIPAEQLYNTNCYSYKDRASTDAMILGEYPKAVQNGIAVLRPFEVNNKPLWRPATIDRQGHYDEPLRKLAMLFNMGIEQFTDNNPCKKEALQELDTILQGLGDELYYIKAYDKAIELVAEGVGLPQIKELAPNYQQELERVKAIQTCFRLLYQDINNTHTKLDKHKEQKLKLLKDKLCNIDLGDMELKQFRIEQIVADIHTDYRAFNANREEVLELLTFDRYNNR